MHFESFTISGSSMFFKKPKPKKILPENTSHVPLSSKPQAKGRNVDVDTGEISDISHGLDITGSIVSKGKVRFNGTVKGTLEAESIYVGEDGFVDGKVIATEAVILGRIKGSLKGKKVRLAATSRIEGDTFHEVIAIEDGAIYEGSIKRIKPD